LLLKCRRPEPNVPQRHLRSDVKDHRGYGAWTGEDNGKGGLGSYLRCRNKTALTSHGGKSTAQDYAKAIVVQRWQIWRGNREALACSTWQERTVFPDMLWDLTAASKKIVREHTERPWAECEEPMGCVANEPEQAL